MAMRRPRKHRFRIRLYEPSFLVGAINGPWLSVSIRINRGRDHALQRILRRMNARAPKGARYVID